ncbi:histidine kinase [Flavihumibacter rivuli]|uniref:sensor histidine kinase n=1 Tax=Flavihumibacter rivuli TaxID=2838156 RepID=UPI001BDF1088|nr:histidine kinase [Flavihumibacter rivuli]ULQ55323.1 histidine kinase [Flavihumibacter rivuli]
MFAYRYRYLFMLLLGAYSFLNTLFAEVYDRYQINTSWYVALLAMLLITIAVWESNRLVERWLASRKDILHPWKWLGLLFVTGAILSVLLSYLIITLLGRFSPALHSDGLNVARKLGIMYGTRINLFLHTLNAISFFSEAYRQKDREAEKLKRDTVQAQLQAIRNQVNPHFLFNNLNVLSSLVIKDNPEANAFIESFSRVYRHILKTQEKELVDLQSELDYIQSYIFLLLKRFPESLSVSLHVPEAYLKAGIVPSALQMLIENAIKHNILSKQNPLQIDIAVNGMDSLVVSNNLQVKKQVEESTQVGLRNIARRYELVTGKSIKVVRDDSIFSVHLPLIT